MEHQEIPIRFADLRRLVCEVPAYLARQAGVRTVPGLKAGLEEEFSIAGDDAALLVLDFAEAYQVNAEAFDFSDHIGSDGTDLKSCLLFGPLLLYMLAAWLLKTAVAGLCWLWRPALARHIWHRQVPIFWQTAGAPRALTIGDFVTSAAVGRFVLRGQVRFQLVRA